MSNQVGLQVIKNHVKPPERTLEQRVLGTDFGRPRSYCKRVRVWWSWPVISGFQFIAGFAQGKWVLAFHLFFR